MAALEQQRCGICELELDEPRTLRCGHSFCGDCLEMRRHKLRDECWWCPACGERTGELFGASNDVDNRLGETRLHALAARAPGGVPATFDVVELDRVERTVCPPNRSSYPPLFACI